MELAVLCARRVEKDVLSVTIQVAGLDNDLVWHHPKHGVGKKIASTFNDALEKSGGGSLWHVHLYAISITHQSLVAGAKLEFFCIPSLSMPYTFKSTSTVA